MMRFNLSFHIRLARTSLHAESADMLADARHFGENAEVVIALFQIVGIGFFAQSAGRTRRNTASAIPASILDRPIRQERHIRQHGHEANLGSVHIIHEKIVPPPPAQPSCLGQCTMRNTPLLSLPIHDLRGWNRKRLKSFCIDVLR